MLSHPPIETVLTAFSTPTSCSNPNTRRATGATIASTRTCRQAGVKNARLVSGTAVSGGLPGQLGLDVVVNQLVITTDAFLLVGQVHTLETPRTETALLAYEHADIFLDGWPDGVFRI